jgi:carbon-monoxide dehydrogenase small subunit
MKTVVNLTVNGDPTEILIESDWTLLQGLRSLGLMGAREGCGVGECGACTVLIRDRKGSRTVNSCLMLAGEAEGLEVTTIEGLAQGGKLHPIQQAFIDHGAVQCGFCTPGMIMSAKALLDENPDPDEMEVRAGIAGNICRCTGYNQIVEAVLAAAEIMRGGKS